MNRVDTIFNKPDGHLITPENPNGGGGIIVVPGWAVPTEPNGEPHRTMFEIAQNMGIYGGLPNNPSLPHGIVDFREKSRMLKEWIFYMSNELCGKLSLVGISDGAWNTLNVLTDPAIQERVQSAYIVVPYDPIQFFYMYVNQFGLKGAADLSFQGWRHIMAKVLSKMGILGTNPDKYLLKAFGGANEISCMPGGEEGFYKYMLPPDQHADFRNRVDGNSAVFRYWHQFIQTLLNIQKLKGIKIPITAYVEPKDGYDFRRSTLERIPDIQIIDGTGDHFHSIDPRVDKGDMLEYFLRHLQDHFDLPAEKARREDSRRE